MMATPAGYPLEVVGFQVGFPGSGNFRGSLKEGWWPVESASHGVAIFANGIA